MYAHFKILGLWIYIDKIIKAEEDDNKKDKQNRLEDSTYKTLRIYVKSNTYIDCKSRLTSNKQVELLEKSKKRC